MEDAVPQENPDAPTDEDYAASQVTLRALVTTKEAGVIIGKQGKNVADLRDQTGVKAGVSKVVPGVHDRVLTVTGALENVSKVQFPSNPSDETITDFSRHTDWLLKHFLPIL